MSTFLFDVNVLLALSDPFHLHHEPAHRWLEMHANVAWATCPLTENGFVRIASNPRYPNRPGDAQVVLALLRQFCQRDGHTFWADDISLRTLLEPTAYISPNHITDIYLLGLALSHGGKLLSFDQRIPLGLLKGGAQAFELIHT